MILNKYKLTDYPILVEKESNRLIVKKSPVFILVILTSRGRILFECLMKQPKKPGLGFPKPKEPSAEAVKQWNEIVDRAEESVKEMLEHRDPLEVAREKFLKLITNEDRISYVIGEASDSLEKEIEILMGQDPLFGELITCMQELYDQNGDKDQLREVFALSKDYEFDLRKLNPLE